MNVETTTAQPKAPRWRRWTAGFLIVLSCVLVPLSVLSIWVRNQLLNTDRYVENVTPLASNPEIIDAVANQATTALFDNVDVQQVAEDALPPRASFLAGPLTAGLHEVVLQVAVRAMSTPQFRTAWIEANRVAHEQVRKALTNEGKVVKTANGKITLDLSSLMEQVRLTLKQRGIGIFDRIPINSLALRYELMDSEQLEKAQTATKLLNALSFALPILSLVCLGGGLALSSNRRRSLLRWGIGAAVGAGVIGAGLTVGRSFYLDAVTSDSLPRDTAAAVFDTLVRFLRDGERLMIALGLIVAIAAWLSGPSSAAAKVRATSRSVVGGAGDAAGEHGVNFGGFGVWVSKHRGALRIAAVLSTLVLLVSWNHPRGRTVLFLTVVLLLFLGLIEFVARASTVEHTAATHSSDR
jgi:hypothetical protein